MTRCTFGDTCVLFYFSKFDRNKGSHWMHFCLYMSHPYFACSLVYKLTGSHFISSACEIPSIRLADQNLSSNRGPGYSSQYGIPPTNAWFFPSVVDCAMFDLLKSATKRAPLDICAPKTRKIRMWIPEPG